MRRLYSTFAGGWPGVGLLLMRVVAGSTLAARGTAMLWNDPPITEAIMSAFLAGCGILLISGLWTPIAGALIALVETCHIMTVPGDSWVPLLLGTFGGGIAMLGPGLWSVDARLFGWKRVEARPRTSNPDFR